MDKMRLYLIFYICITGSLLQGCTSDYCRNLGNGYVFCNEGEDLKYIYHEYSIGGEIPPTVLSYKSNKDYIVVKQRPRFSDNQDAICYYIVIKNEKRILGPFPLEQYIKQKKEYGITLMVEDTKWKR